LYELAVLDSNGELTYDTPVTNDVIGYLRDIDVTDVMEKIQQLQNGN
jgi:U3 small nucleolar RNA-associated protein 14